MVEIIKVKWGVSNHYSNPERIEINEHLFEPEFEGLKNRIILHEKKHSKAKGFWKQREIDMKSNLKFSHLFKFYKKHPKTFLQQNFPINYSKEKNTLFIEWSRIFLIMIYAGILFGVYSLINLFSTDSIFFWKVIKYIILILVGSLLLMFIGKKLKNHINKEANRPVSKKNS